MNVLQSKLVSVSNLLKIYPGPGGKDVTAVNDVSLDIKPGEFMTLLGPSGCGKTTILRMIAGFEMPTSGELLIGGERVTNLTPDKRDTSMVFQSYALFPHLSVFENIAYGLRIKKLGEKDIRHKVSQMLELVGLSGLETRYPNQLSGGQQQRIALARSLVMEPAVLLFDEPLSNLDAKLRVYMRGEIRKIQKATGITSIYVTHDQAEAMSMSDRITIMNKGIIEQTGTPYEVYTRPATQFVADFIGVANIIDGVVESTAYGNVQIRLFDKIYSAKTGLSLLSGQSVKVVLRPEAISVATQGDIRAAVESSVFMGAYQDYKIAAGGRSLMVVDNNPAHKKVFQAGEDVYLNISTDSIHIIA